ncbi:MAG: hypothetical protein ACXWFY_06455, partial [Chthoniobacterales bacterium]
YALIHFRLRQHVGKVQITAEQTEGDLPPRARKLDVRLVTQEGEFVAAGDFSGAAEWPLASARR